MESSATQDEMEMESNATQDEMEMESSASQDEMESLSCKDWTDINLECICDNFYSRNEKTNVIKT